MIIIVAHQYLQVVCSEIWYQEHPPTSKKRKSNILQEFDNVPVRKFNPPGEIDEELVAAAAAAPAPAPVPAPAGDGGSN